MPTISPKTILGGCALLVSFALIGKAEQVKPAPGDWPSYDHDPAATRYSPLTQINTKNVATLKPAWTFSLRGSAPAPRFGGGGSEATPIVVNGILYVTASARVVALDPVTGKEVWSYTPAKGRPSTRGVAYWPGDKQNPPRIIFTAGRDLIALNATTGKIDPGFGNEGVVDMVVGYSRYSHHFSQSGDGGRKRFGIAGGAARRYARLRCPHRREAMGFSYRAAAGRGGS